MPAYELTLEDRKKYLYVLVSGELNRKTDREIDTEIRSECESRALDKVLIDIRECSSRISYLDNFVAATTYRQRMGSYIKVIAIVDSGKHRQSSELFELAAVNKGARLRFFTSSIDAEKWLLEDEERNS